MIVLILITVFVLPFANGANDNSTGVATVVGVGLAIAIGGLLAARRVGETMRYRITEMNDAQVSTANLITAGCVIVASRFGVPVSTIRVCGGSLLGIGLINRQARWGVIGRITLAWLLTLPLASAIGFAS